MARWKGKYDWESWFAKTWFKIVRGRHYVCGNGVMQQQVRTAAYKRGLKVSIDELEDGLKVRVTERGVEKRAKVAAKAK